MIGGKAVCTALLLVAASGAAACDWSEDWPEDWVAMIPAGTATAQAALRIPEPPVPVSRPFDVDIRLCAPQNGPSVTGIALQAIMPRHQHGMNYRPEIARTNETDFLASGLFFHMPGDWRIELSVFTEDGPRHFDLVVPAR